MKNRLLKKRIKQGWIKDIKGFWRKRNDAELWQYFLEICYPPDIIRNLVYRENPFFCLLPKEFKHD